jgi:hypothetical protein
MASASRYREYIHGTNGQFAKLLTADRKEGAIVQALWHAQHNSNVTLLGIGCNYGYPEEESRNADGSWTYSMSNIDPNRGQRLWWLAAFTGAPSKDDGYPTYVVNFLYEPVD